MDEQDPSARSTDDLKADGNPSHEERRTRVFAETASDAIITIDDQSTMCFVNPAAERIFGYSRQEMIGQSLTMLMPDYLRHIHRVGLKRYLETGKRHISWQAVELPGLHKNGKEIPLELSFGEFIDKGKRFFTGIARDVTERKRLERRLSAQYHAARILAEAHTLDEAAPLLLQALCENLGWELGQFWLVDHETQTLRWIAAWHTQGLEAAEFETASHGRTFESGVGLPGRIWKSGSPVWLADVTTDSNFPRGPVAARIGLRSAFGFPVMLGGNVSGVLEFFSRESQEPDRILLETMSSAGNQIGQFFERKRIESEREQIVLREQRARREAEVAMDRVRSVQKVTDGALAHLTLDELLAELLDRVREVMEVDTVAILLLESDGDELVAWAARGLEEEVELGLRIPVGAGFAGRIAATKAPVRIDDVKSADLANAMLKDKGIHCLLGVPLLAEGRVIGVIHVGKLTPYQFTTDDTHLLQLVADRVALAIDNARLFEEEHSARQEAEAASRAKDEFLTTLSHELRTPLTPIIGWIHMIRTGLVPRNDSEHGLAVIDKNSQALKHLINDLLDMSAILTGKMRIERTPVKLEAVLREAIETVRPLARENQIDLETSFSNGTRPIVVSADRTRLIQVFWNLLHNAVKFSHKGGRVRVTCEAGKADAVIRIEDVGRGIPPDFLPHVFERFRQADGSKTRLFGGLGLGLALVKSFVEAHGGTVEAESSGEGHGSRFTVHLPLETQTAQSSSARKRRVPTADVVMPQRVLIVDDDEDTLEMLGAAFERRGYHVTACDSATSAVAAAEGNIFDLIISDIGMPRVDGYELLRRLRSLSGFETIPAIALTGYASTRDAEAAMAAGFAAHISKPVDPLELAALTDQILRDRTGDSN